MIHWGTPIDTLALGGTGFAAVLLRRAGLDTLKVGVLAGVALSGIGYIRNFILLSCTFLSSLPPGRVLFLLVGGHKAVARMNFGRRDLITDSKVLMRTPGIDGVPPDEAGFHATIGEGGENHILFAVPTSDPFWAPRNKAVRALVAKQLPSARRVSAHSVLARLQPGVHTDFWHSVAEATFPYFFEVLFGYPPTEELVSDLLPGLIASNNQLKRKCCNADRRSVERALAAIDRILAEDAARSHFHTTPECGALGHLSKQNTAFWDEMHALVVQSTDLILHMLLLRHEHLTSFDTNLEYSAMEAVRCYPLSEFCYFRTDKFNLFVSLELAGVTGWSDPYAFLPSRWSRKPGAPITQINNSDNKFLMAMMFGTRRCPGWRLGMECVQHVLEALFAGGLEFTPAENFCHERSFYTPLLAHVRYAGDPGGPPKPFRIQTKFWDRVRYMFYRNARIVTSGELW